jgi:hypothetical protein
MGEAGARDRLTAGVVLARHIVADPAKAKAAWQAVADFHAAVVRPLIGEDGMDAAARTELLAWAWDLGAATTLDTLAELVFNAEPAPPWPAESSLGVIDDLMKLAEQIAEPASGRPPPGGAPEVLIGGPGGRSVVLTVQGEDGAPWRPGAVAWRAGLGAAEQAEAEASVRTVMSALPGRQADAAASRLDGPGVCWPPGVAIAPADTALPMALWRLGQITSLPAPPLLSAGQFNGARFSAVREPQLASYGNAARATGRDLLVPTSTGWRLIRADGSAPQDHDAVRTLDGAASVVWGESWEQWKRTAHAAELARLGWHFVDWRQVPASQPVTDRKVTQVWQLERYCVDKASPGSLMILGGPAHSGRSCIVRQLAASLSQRKHPWLVRVIGGQQHGLPDRHIALEAATHALACAGLTEAQKNRCLLVFEDLQPIGDGDASDALRYVAEQLKILVLGVLEYTENSIVEWNTEDAFVAPAVVNADARKRFVLDLAAADKALDPAPALEALAGDTWVDLRMLTELMTGEEDIAGRRAARFAELTEEERAALVSAAAVSMVSGDVEADELGAVGDADRRLFGVGPGRAPGTLRLMSALDCAALLELSASGSAPVAAHEVNWHTVDSAIGGQLEPELNLMFWDGDPAVVERLNGVRLYRGELCHTLLKRAGDEPLTEWAVTAPLMSVIRMLSLVDLMPDEMARKMVDKLVTRTLEESARWPPGRLLTLMHACQRVEFLMSGEALDALVPWLIRSVNAAIAAGAGRPDERFALLVGLERLNRDDARNVIAERAPDVLAGLKVRVDDYLLVQRVEALQRRAENRLNREFEVPTFHVDQEPPVQFLLAHNPDPDDGVGVLLQAMNLKLRFGESDREFETIFAEYETALNRALRTATAPQLARALQDIRTPIPQLCTWLLWHWPEFPARARDLMWRSAGATDAAALLSAVARANIQIAFQLISHDDHDRLADALAKRAGAAKDAKGVGQLLSAAKSVEEYFGSGGGFSAELAEALGEANVRALIRYDPRTSVRYHVIKGVWDVQASYRGEVLDDVLSVVIDSVQRGRKHWGPEIALRLALDPEMGVATLTELRGRISSKVLLSGMTSALTGHGRALYHRLGRALHPDIAVQFRDQWDAVPFAEGLATSSPTAALEFCVEVGRTLTDADVPQAGQVIVAATGGAERWAHRLRFGRQQEAFAQAIRDLTTLDRATAGEVLDRLRATETRATIAGRPGNVLLARLRHALLDGPTVAPTMLRAIYEVRPQMATDLLTEIEGDRHAIYVFRGEIQQVQDPMAQSAAARNIVRAGGTLSSTHHVWINPLYGVRVQSLPYFTGPRSVTALLRMMAAWDADWGATAARAVNVSSVRSRLRHGALTDVTDATWLVRTLGALDNADAALQILEELLGLDVVRLGEHLDVSLLCALLDVSLDLKPDAVPRFSRALATAVRSLVERPVILDERAHWLLVGRACRLLHQAGAPPVRAGRARVPPNAVYAPAVAWAATGLNQPGWETGAVKRATVRLAASPPAPDVTDRACALSVTGLGVAPELRAAQAGWDVATAPFWLLRLLYLQEATDPWLVPILAQCAPVISQRVNRPTVRSDWDASRLRFRLEARTFAQTRLMTGVAPRPPESG